MSRPARILASVLASSPIAAHAKPVKPGIHRQAESAVQACQPYAEHIKAAERANGLARHSLTALLWSESRCKATAYNKWSKAAGMGQHTRSGAAAVGRIQRARGETTWFTYARALDPVASIQAAATLLAYGLETCSSLVEAIGLYNTGHCRPNAFSRAVLRLAAAIRFVMELEEPRS